MYYLVPFKCAIRPTLHSYIPSTLLKNDYFAHCTGFVNLRNIAKFPSNSIECQLERFIREKK